MCGALCLRIGLTIVLPGFVRLLPSVVVLAIRRFLVVKRAYQVSKFAWTAKS